MRPPLPSWHAQQYEDDPRWLVVDEHDNPIAEDLTEAHAHLIAKAPSLLDALTRLMVKLDEYEWPQIGDMATAEDRAYVEAAKADARGLVVEFAG